MKFEYLSNFRMCLQTHFQSLSRLKLDQCKSNTIEPISATEFPRKALQVNQIINGDENSFPYNHTLSKILAGNQFSPNAVISLTL